MKTSEVEYTIYHTPKLFVVYCMALFNMLVFFLLIPKMMYDFNHIVLALMFTHLFNAGMFSVILLDLYTTRMGKKR